MDTLHVGIFYATSALAVAGGLVAALARSRTLGTAGLLAAAVGAALLMADLAAGFAALLTFILLLAAAAVAAGAPAEDEGPASVRHNLNAIAVALLFGALAYAAYRGIYHSARYPGGQFNAGALGRLLVGRDALAVIATAAAGLIAVGSLPALGRSERRR